MKKISLIIPVYNSEKFIDKLFLSIINQNYENYEIIVVNDGSTDDSLKIIEKYQTICRKINCITIENSGPGTARKVGFKNSTGELLFFIDSDDFLPNNMILDKINKLYQKTKFDILFFNYIAKNIDGERIFNTFKIKIAEGEYSNEYLYKHPTGGALWNKVFVKQKMKEEYFCDDSNFEDYYTTYKYLENCNNFYYSQEILYYSNRDNQNSISKIQSTDKFIHTIELLEKIYKFSKYKIAVMTIMCRYYMFVKKYIYRHKINDIILEERLKKLKKYINEERIFKLNLKSKEFIKYFIIRLVDVIGGKK